VTEETYRAVVGKVLGVGPEHVRLEQASANRFVVRVHSFTSSARMAAIALALDRVAGPDVTFSIEPDPSEPKGNA
jgi:hypothetical protein